MSYDPPTTWADVPGAVRAALEAPLVKRADGLVGLSPMADVLGWRAGPINAHWGGPRPLTNLLIGGALGSLGGYGLGRLAEEVIPERYLNAGGLRRRGALLGGLLGAAPALWQASDSIRHTGRLGSVFEKWPPDPEDTPPTPIVAPEREALNPAGGLAVRPMAEFGKYAADLFDPRIGRDDVNRIAWEDPNLPGPLRAATSGLYEAASSVSGSPTVSPWDVAKIAVGAGGGLVSGVLAGKALGLLCGLSPEAQRGVQNIGLAAGLLRATVPAALGLR